MAGVDVARLSVEGDPRARGGAQSDDHAVGRKRRRLNGLADVLAPNHAARHRVPQPEPLVVAARQELRLVRVHAQRPQFVRVAHHHRLERRLDKAGNDAITSGSDEHAIVLPLGHRPYRAVLLWNLKSYKQREAPLYRLPLSGLI